MKKNKKNTIIISVFTDLVTDQRVLKTAEILHENGYEITLVGRKLRTSPGFSSAYPFHRIKVLFQRGFPAYAEWNIRLFFYLLFHKKNVLLANDLDTLPANYLISMLLHLPLVYDSHELFTEVPELKERKFVKWFWEKTEAWIFPHLKNIYTVSESVAGYYRKKYAMDVKVVRNLPLKNRKREPYEMPFPVGEKKIILYQGAVNMGRGLELAIDSMALLDDFVLIIAGAGPVKQALRERVKDKSLEASVFFTGRLSPAQLADLTRKARVGLSIEEDLGLNYRFALPNKLFDYIHAGVPVMVSDLPEMKSIVRQYGIGEVLEKRTPENFARTVRYLLDAGGDMDFETAANELNWENESRIILDVFHNL